MNQATTPDLNGERAPSLDLVKVAVEAHFPHLWAAVDLGLATAATLLLKDNVNPTAVILVGGPSAGKTTVATMLEGARVRLTPDRAAEPLCYRSDKFTPAAFVSQAANQPKDKLSKIDLLPKIKDKVLLTPELASIFRGDEDALTNTFSVVTRVLDGQGFVTDSGTNGQRGYTGDHLFAWLGCTTPLPDKAWRVMGQLGSRLFFLMLDTAPTTTFDDLLAIEKGMPYPEKLAACRGAVHEHLSRLFGHHGGVRSVSWDSDRDEPEARPWLARCAVLLSAMRSVPSVAYDGDRRTYRPGDREAPYRALAVLTNLARGHALVHGREGVTMSDLPLIAQVTASSMPTDAARLLRALVLNGKATLTVAEAQSVFAVSHPETARDRMRYVAALGAMEFDEAGVGKTAVLRFRRGWEWCAGEEFRALLLCGKPVRNRGLCRVPPTNNPNKQSKGEEAAVEGTDIPHTPQKMTGSSPLPDDETARLLAMPVGL